MTLPRITIITPSFNQGRYLERTIKSVLDQGYPNLEYFVIDGGSTDESPEIIRAYADRLAGWVVKKDRGQTDAINKGLAWATGEIVAFLNSDDMYAPGTLARVGDLMRDPHAVPWLVGQTLMIDTSDQFIEAFNHHEPASFTQYLMHTSGMIPQPSSFWSAALFRRLGGFDLGLHYVFDYEWNCRLLASGYRPWIIEDPLAWFRVHPESKGCSTPIRFGLERMVVAKRYSVCLSWWQRFALMRNLGYRQRAYAVQLAKLSDPRRLWRDVVRRPWWLASQQVREALWELSSDHANAA